jgi:hypothetical protein
MRPYLRTYYDEQKRADQMLREEFESQLQGVSFIETNRGGCY